MEVSFAAEQIAHIGSFSITNTFLTSIITSVLLITFAFYFRNRIVLVPSRLQTIVELIIEEFYSFTTQLAGKRAAFIFPWFATFFFFIIVANWLGLLPGFGTVGFFHEEHGEAHLIPLFRGVNSDLNITLALALISVFVTHFFSIKTLGIAEYLKRYFSLNPINLFVGLLELIGEFTKVASLSFRLFGNVFAGEALLTTVASLSKTKLTAFFIPIPFMMLEVVVGLVQALVFSMLTLVFMVILSTSHSENH